MAVSASRPVVSDTEPTLLTPGAERDAVKGRSVAIYNPGPVDIAVGGPRVGFATGFRLPAGRSLSADLSAGERLYGIADTAPQEADVLQVGL